MTAHIYSGTSGWVYAGWRAHLYADTPVKRWLEVASTTFDSLEINGSFYTQISPATYERWRDTTPPGFRFAVKGHRFVTHYKRLRDCRDSIIRLRDQASHLGPKLAAVVWQLPTSLRCDLARLDDFIAALSAWRTRHAIELRHRSWFVPDVATRLRDSGVAVCLSDAPDFPLWREVTADFVYVRLHGHTRKYASSYSAASLQKWAADATRWRDGGRDVFVYFDNDAEGHAVANALSFARLTRAGARDPCGLMPRNHIVAGKRVAARVGMAPTLDVLEILQSQHTEVDQLFEKLESGNGDRPKLFAELADKLAAHATVEEKLFYPAVMSKDTSDLLHESVEEHLEIKRTIADMLSLDPEADEDEFDAKLNVLKENVSHHAHEEEESKLFPKVRKMMDADERAALGNEVLAMFESLVEEEPRRNVPNETTEAAPLPNA